VTVKPLSISLSAGTYKEFNKLVDSPCYFMKGKLMQINISDEAQTHGMEAFKRKGSFNRFRLDT
jgi:hypothetical protein